MNSAASSARAALAASMFCSSSAMKGASISSLPAISRMCAFLSGAPSSALSFSTGVVSTSTTMSAVSLALESISRSMPSSPRMSSSSSVSSGRSLSVPMRLSSSEKKSSVSRGAYLVVTYDMSSMSVLRKYSMRPSASSGASRPSSRAVRSSSIWYLSSWLSLRLASYCARAVASASFMRFLRLSLITPGLCVCGRPSRPARCRWEAPSAAPASMSPPRSPKPARLSLPCCSKLVSW
mmetsp:Transcript_1303/g.3818  ORF Transcript_1303/g.3818 Transcript_1303/m.3818 type:complete len:237 (-) Transcript_1303:133-843(-)